jgi:hypothetical protein
VTQAKAGSYAEELLADLASPANRLRLQAAELLCKLTRHRRMGALGGDEHLQKLVQLCDPQQPTL